MRELEKMNLGNETETLEFKKSMSELKEGIISLSSMLNKSSYGILYIGVKNNGDIVGQQIGEHTLKTISEAIANFIKPQVIPSIIVEFIEDFNIIKVEVKGNNKPYSAYGKYYMRSSDEDREIAPNNLRDLMITTYVDSIVKMESTNQFLSFNQLKNIYLLNNLTINETIFEENLNLVNENGKYNLMAEILADSNSFSIKVATFEGVDKTKLIKRNEYGYKCLLIAMTQVLDYVEALNETKVEINGIQRKETKLFDFSCFREAWLNACLHNKWSRLTPPAVYIYSNRIEIISTGGLPLDYSEEDFYVGRSKPVNLELQKIMGQLNYIEQTGHGVPLIVSKYGKNVFDISENFITVTLPFAFTKNKFEDNTINEKLDDLNDKQKQIINLIKENRYITVDEMVKILNFGQTTVNKNLKIFKESKIIERIGSNKNGYWKILN